jgi:NCAIR mutase (PurE)-related protein
MRDVLRRLLAGELDESGAEALLRRVQLQELAGAARLDVGREDRRGVPEVVLASGKSPEETARLLTVMARERGQGLGSRLEAAHWSAVEREAATAGHELRRYRAGVRVLRPGFTPEPRAGRVGILTAGTSDLAAAQEALMVVEACGHPVRLEADVGVAGLHRLLGPRPSSAVVHGSEPAMVDDGDGGPGPGSSLLADLLAWRADVLVVAAGMDGVLPGVVAGLVDRPVIGLPVSTGYGVGGGGKAALLTMLQSCSSGLVVVNVDNGVGAGTAAVLIARRAGASGDGSRPGPASPG